MAENGHQKGKMKASGRGRPADSQHPRETNMGQVGAGPPHHSGIDNVNNERSLSSGSHKSLLAADRFVDSFNQMPDDLKPWYEKLRDREIHLRKTQQAIDRDKAALQQNYSGLENRVADLRNEAQSLEDQIQTNFKSLRAAKQAELDELSGSVSQLEGRIAKLKSTESELTMKIQGILNRLADRYRKLRSVEGMPGVDDSEPSPPASEAADADTADLGSQLADLQRRLEAAIELQPVLQAKEKELDRRERALQARESALPSPGENTSPKVDARDSDAEARDARNEELEKQNADLKRQREELKRDCAGLKKRTAELAAEKARISEAGKRFEEEHGRAIERVSKLDAEVRSRDAQVGELRRSADQAMDQLGVVQSQRDQARKALDDINRAQDKFREDGLRMAAETRDEFLKAVMAPIYEGVVEAATEAAGRLAHMRLAMQESEARRETSSERTARDFLKPVLSGRAAIQLREFLEAEPRGSERDGKLMQRLVEDLRPFPGTRAHGLLDEARAKEIELRASEGDRFVVVGLLRGAQVSIPEAFKDCYSVPVGVPSAGVYQVERPGWMVGRAVLLPAILGAVPVS